MHELSASAPGASMRAPNSVSKRFVRGPVLIQPERSACPISRISSSPTAGGENRRKSARPPLRGLATAGTAAIRSGAEGLPFEDPFDWASTFTGGSGGVTAGVSPMTPEGRAIGGSASAEARRSHPPAATAERGTIESH